MAFELTVLIPTLNERENIRSMISTIDAICKSYSINEEILVVDDNSRDGTIEIVESLMSEYNNLHIFIRKDNHGLSQSIYDGIIHAQSDIVQCIDCDFSHPPDKIPDLYYCIRDNGCDMALGSRYIKEGGVINWPFSRRMISLLAALVSKFIIPHLTDSGSGFFIINRHILDNTHLTPRGFRMAFEILGKAHWNKIQEIPIIFKDREIGNSKLNFGIICDYVVQCLSILKYNFIDRRSGNIIRSWKIFLHLL